MKTFVAMRGPSGVGKTTVIKRDYPEAFVVSTDNFFMVEVEDKGRMIVDGDESRFGTKLEYQFDATKLGEAHSWCQQQFLKAIINRKSTIVLDNTNTNVWEFQNYVTIAEMHGYHVVLHEVVPDTLDDLRDLVARNEHGTPPEIVCRMALGLATYDGDSDVTIKNERMPRSPQHSIWRSAGGDSADYVWQGMYSDEVPIERVTDELMSKVSEMPQFEWILVQDGKRYYPNQIMTREQISRYGTVVNAARDCL